jgi:DNA-binding NarL/FixJ family response regulator
VNQNNVVPGYRQDRDAENLTARERQVRDLLKTGLDQNGVAAEVGLTKQRISQIVKALEKKAAIRRRGDLIEFLAVESVVKKGGGSGPVAAPGTED